MTAGRSEPKSSPSPQEGSASSPSSKPVRVLIVDDHPVVRDGIRRTIEREEHMVVCGEAASASEALAILENERCDLAIVDISMEGRSGLDLVKEITTRGLECPVLVFTVHDDASYAERALRAGARGYVLKQDGPKEVTAALRRILAGEVYVCDRMAGRLISGLVGSRRDAIDGSPIARLSDRELEVLEAIGAGHGPRAIAQSLGISVSTIETYKANIKTKLELKDAAQLGSFAAQWLHEQRA